MARTQRNARSWLVIIGLLWLAFLGAVLIVMITQRTGPGGIFGAGAQDDAQTQLVSSPGDGWFTDEQAVRGADAYALHCAQCHGAQLAGGTGPALAGDPFWTRWEGDSVHAFFSVASQTMPQDAPGSLDDNTYADLTAFVMAYNGFPEGEAELPPDESVLAGLTIEQSAATGEAGEPDPEGPRTAAEKPEGADADAAAADEQAPEAADERGFGEADAEVGPESDPGAPGAPQVDAEARAEERTETAEDTPAGDEAERTDAPDAEADEPDAAATEEPDAEVRDADAADGDDAEADDPDATAPHDEGWFTEAQVEAGGDAFAQHCARCHGEDLQGSPPLVGDGFPERYTTVWELYQYARQAMPLDNPGSLDNQTYADAIAFILHENGYATGDVPLEHDRARMEEMAFAAATTDDAAGTEGEDAEAEAEAGDSAEGADGNAAPAPGRASLVIEAEPANVTINLLGPDGLARRAIGAQTLTDLAPGVYVIAASRGHEHATTTVTLGTDESATVRLVLDELSRSGDVPAEPAVPATEVPAIPRDPGDALIGQRAEATQEEPADAGEGDGADDAGEDAEPSDPAPDAEREEADAETAAVADTEAREGWFSQEQADRGQDPFQQHCASCHGEDLQGEPPLVGEPFLASFDTVWDLFDYAHQNMPQNDPGSLDDDTYADIVAFVLRENEFPAGEEEFQPGDEEAMREMSLDAEAAAGDAAADEDAARDAAADDADAERAPATMLQAERGTRTYALHCSRCHGENLAGNVAPALAGSVFLERWGGHPVDWLYFQASAAMPPHAPGSLSAQQYADIIVFVMREAGVLEGTEEFGPHDEAFRTLVVVPRTEAEVQPGLEERVQRLRDQLHAGQDEDGVPLSGSIMPHEWPDDPGASPIGPRGRTDAAIDAEPGVMPADADAEGEGTDKDEDDEDGDPVDEEDGAQRRAPLAVGA